MIFLLVALFGFIAQFIDGTLGMGYGVTSSSLLISLGIAPVIASASVHTAEIFVSLISGISHFRFGNVNRKLFLQLTIFGILGGILGAYGLVNLPTKPVRIVVSSILFILGLVIFLRFWARRNLKEPQINKENDYSTSKVALLGFFAAFIDAVGGGGWGPICTPSLIVTGTEPRKAVGSVNLAEFFITIAITLTFIFSLGYEKFRWDLVAPLIIAGACAAPLAAYLCKRLPQKILGMCVGILVMFLNARTVIIASGILKLISGK